MFAVVLLISFVFSISAAFEYQLVSKEYKSDELCNRSQTSVENATVALQAAETTRLDDNEKALKSAERNDSGYNFNEDESIMPHHRLERSSDNDVFLAGINSTEESFDYSKLSHKTSYNPADADHYVNDEERDNVTSRDISKRNHNTCSTVSDFYRLLKRIAGERHSWQ